MELSSPPGRLKPGGLAIEVSGDVDRREVVLRGDLDLCTAGELRNALHECAALGTRLVMVDLAELNFMSAAGLHELTDAHQMLNGYGARLVLRHPTRAALRILQLTGVDTVLSVEADTDNTQPAATSS